MNLAQEPSRILLIDDNPDDRLLAFRELRQEFSGAEIREAAGWPEVEQALAANNFDFVITDYELNWATGLDVLRAVKAQDPDRPVVMFTSSGTQEVAVEAMKSGLDDYVIKSPRHFSRLRRAVHTVWQNTQIRRKARELEFRLEFLLNELHVGVFRSTLDGQLIEVSDGLLRLLNLPSLAEAQQFFQRHLALTVAERSEQRQWHREIWLDAQTGGPLWLKISETRVELNGQVLIDGLISDITEQKRVAAEMRSLNRNLEQRVEQRTRRLQMLNEELEMFAFSVSHDLRAPIRQIDGFINLLQQQLGQITSDETVQHYLHTLTELTEHSNGLIEDLLQFSRTGRAEMQYTVVDMNHLVREVRRQLEVQTQGRTIHWNINRLPLVEGDRNLLRQVWQNLLENAVKYTRLREQAEITIGGESGIDETTFFVRDNGIGFESENTKSLFGVFQRLSNAQDFEGTGIGLANVKRVISRHAGRVWAEGKLDEYAVFSFALPNSKHEE